MSKSYFDQECPTCGRHLKIRVAYLGKMVVCQHCQGRFQACDSVTSAASALDSQNPLLQRADELLSTFEEQSDSRVPR